MPKDKGSKAGKSMAELIAEERRKRGLPSAATKNAKPEKIEKKRRKNKALKLPTAEELAWIRGDDDSEAEGAVAAAEDPDLLRVAPQLVQYTDLRLGDGNACVKLRSNVVVEYTGRLASSGHVFDQSRVSAPLQFKIGTDAVVEGFEDGMLGMKLGGERRIHVTPELGYGSDGLAACKIPPNASLQFEVKLVGLS